MPADVFSESVLKLLSSHAQQAAEYQRAWSYYQGREFEGDAGVQYAHDRKLFKLIKHVFGFVAQAVDTDVRFGMRQKLGLDGDETLVKYVQEVWERSNFQAEKYRLARNSCNLGDAYLIAQMRDERPYLVVANSEDIYLHRSPDDREQVDWARQSYAFVDENGREHTRDWVYWPDRVERYTDAHPGSRPDEGWPVAHPFGEVPVIWVPALDLGEQYGFSVWHHVQPQLDSLNELAAFANAILLRYADPLLVGSGVDGAESPPVVQRGADGTRILWLPRVDAKIDVVEYRGQVLGDLLNLVKEIAGNIRDQLPELALADIRDEAGLSGYAVSLKLSDLVAKIHEIRGNWANAIEWANALILRAVMNQPNRPLEDFATRVQFEPVLPPDRIQQLEGWEAEDRLGIVSKHEFLRRDGLSDKEIQERLQEIEDESGSEAFGQQRLGEEAATGGAE